MKNNFERDLDKKVKELKEIIKELNVNLDQESVEEVNRLLNHDEYEMAFEGLLLELINNKILPNPFNFGKYKKMAESLSLNSESVFDHLFWEKFLEWGKGNPKS